LWHRQHVDCVKAAAKYCKSKADAKKMAYQWSVLGHKLQVTPLGCSSMQEMVNNETLITQNVEFSLFYSLRQINSERITLQWEIEGKGCTVGDNYNRNIQILDLYDLEACHCRVVSSDSGTVTEVGDVHRGWTFCLKYRVSLLSCLQARQLHRKENLHPPVHSVTAAVLSDSMKETSLIFVKKSPVHFVGVLNNHERFIIAGRHIQRYIAPRQYFGVDKN